MKKRGTFLLSLVLVLSLCLGMMPAGAFAESEAVEEKAVEEMAAVVEEKVVEEEAPAEPEAEKTDGETLYEVEYLSAYPGDAAQYDVRRTLTFTQFQIDNEEHFKVSPHSASLSMAAPEGYFFVRWEELMVDVKSASGTVFYCTLYAIWEEIPADPTYTVLYFSGYPDEVMMEPKQGSIDYLYSELQANKHFDADPGCDELQFATPEGYRFVGWVEMIKGTKSSMGTYARLEACWEPVGGDEPTGDIVRFVSAYPEEPWYNSIPTYPNGTMPADVTKDLAYNENTNYYDYEPEDVGMTTPFGYMFDHWEGEMNAIAPPIYEAKGVSAELMAAAPKDRVVEPVLTLTAVWRKIGIEYVTNYPKEANMLDDSIMMPGSIEYVNRGEHLRLPLRYTGFETPEGYRFVRWEAVEYNQVPIDPRPPIDEVRDAKSVKTTDYEEAYEQTPQVIDKEEIVLVPADSDVLPASFYVRAIWAERTSTSPSHDPEPDPEPTPEPEPEPTPEPTPEPDPEPVVDDSDVNNGQNPFAGAEGLEEDTDEDAPLVEHSPYTGDVRSTAVWFLCSMLSLFGIVILLWPRRREE